MNDTTKCPKCGDCLKRDTVHGHKLTVLWYCCGSHIQSNGSNFRQHPTCRERELTNKLAEAEQVAIFALDHVTELREAWRTGALHERDDGGGTRSNRNVDVERKLRKLIERLRGTEAS